MAKIDDDHDRERPPQRGNYERRIGQEKSEYSEAPNTKCSVWNSSVHLVRFVRSFGLRNLSLV